MEETLPAVPTFPCSSLQVPHASSSYKDSNAPFLPSSPPHHNTAAHRRPQPPATLQQLPSLVSTRCCLASLHHGLCCYRPQTHPQVLQSQELDLFHLLLRLYSLVISRALRPVLRLPFDHLPHARIDRLQPLPDRRDAQHSGDAQTWLPRTHLPRRASCCSRSIQDGVGRPFHACFGL